MISNPMRPRRCKHCREKFAPDRAGQLVHVACIEGYLATQYAKKTAKQAKEQKARQRVEKAMDRKRKEALKTIPKLRAEAQVEFNRYIRERDRLLECISCGAPPPDLSGLHAGRDAGHYRSTGAASHLRFDERNCHAQCVHCNQHLAGNAVAYRGGLVRRIGLGSVEALESDNTPVKWDRDTLRQIRTIYRAKTRALRKEQP